MYMWYAAHTYTTGISGVAGCAGALIPIYLILTTPTIQTRVSRAVNCVCLTGGSFIAIHTHTHVLDLYMSLRSDMLMNCSHYDL